MFQIVLSVTESFPRHVDNVKKYVVGYGNLIQKSPPPLCLCVVHPWVAHFVIPHAPLLVQLHVPQVNDI